MESQEFIDEQKTGIGNVLRLIRIARNLSTRELAAKMNVSPSYVSDVETNKKMPSWDMLTKFSEALKVRKSTIVYFDEEREEEGYNYEKLLLKILQKISEL